MEEDFCISLDAISELPKNDIVKEEILEESNLWDQIISKYSLFEDALERARCKASKFANSHQYTVKIFEALLQEIDALLSQTKSMLELCCNNNESSQNSLHLSQFQTSHLFGSNSLTVKSLNEFPTEFREKLLPDIKFIEPEQASIPPKNKKKRSRQRFSQCDKCLKSWNDIRSFEVHQKEPGKCPGKPWFKYLPDKTYQCIHPLCTDTQKEFPDQSSYWTHVREKHWVEQDLVIQCSYCREKFPLIEMMKFHIKIAHPKTKMCRFCGSVFASKNDLAKHERTHTGEKPFACDKCTFRTSTAGTLRGHIKRRHEDPNLHRTFLCTQCEKGFFSAFDLKQHILTHSDVKRYTCPACGKQLKNDSCYRRHMMCVHGQKFSCELCSKDFSALMGLNIHKRDVHGIIS